MGEDAPTLPRTTGDQPGGTMAKAWAISGVGERTREAVTAAAQQAGMPVGAWVEQALGKALEGSVSV
jgi:hypothetical protein